MLLRWFVRVLGACGIVVIALTEAIHVVRIAVTGNPVSGAGAVIVSIVVAVVLTVAGTCVLRKVISTAHYDGDERDYMIAAWLCGLFGVLLIVVESAFELPALRHWKVRFIFEELLLGVAALFALAEEVRLFRRPKVTSEELAIFRDLLPARKDGTDGDADESTS